MGDLHPYPHSHHSPLWVPSAAGVRLVSLWSREHQPCCPGAAARSAPAGMDGLGTRAPPPRPRDMAHLVLNCLLSLMLSKASGSRVNVSHTVIYGCQVGVIADSGIFAACSLSAWQITWCRGAPARPRPLGTPGDSPGTAVTVGGTARRAAHPSGQEGSGSSIGSTPRCRAWAPSWVIAWVWFPRGCPSRAGAACARHDGANPTHVSAPAQRCAVFPGTSPE